MHVARAQETAQSEAAELAEAAQAGDESVEGSQEVYERMLGQAQEAAAPGRRQTYRGNLPLARHNLKRGLVALREHKTEVEKREGITLAGFESLLQVVVALGWALSLRRRVAPTPSEVPVLVTEAYALRRLFIKSLDAVIEKGLLPATVLEKVRPGQGHSDMLGDLLDLVGTFQEEKNREILAGRTPVEPSDLARADTVAQRLQLVITPKGGASAARKQTELSDLDTIIDGLWTLIVEGHREMRKSGFLLWEDALDDYVPLLLSREVPRKKKVETTTDPQPAA